MSTEEKPVQKPVTSQQAKQWIRSKEGQEAMAQARQQAKTAVKELEVRDKSLSQLVRQKTARSS